LIEYLSICSGIEAATVAWHPLGWKCVGVSEIEPFRSAILKYHYPEVKNFGDFTEIKEDDFRRPISLLVGGTPCASFSIAGLRKGFTDDRGNLALEFIKLADRLKPSWVVWENVPGVLSSDEGRDFGCFLGGLAEVGYGFSYRVLDAQYIRTQRFPRAVPQRRRRVFVVGYFGDWRNTAKVLFDREALSGHPPPSRTKREGHTDKSEGSIGGNDTEYWRKAGRKINYTYIEEFKEKKVSSTLMATGRHSMKENAILVKDVMCFEQRSPDGGAPRVQTEDMSPTLTAMTGGNRQPCVYIKFKKTEPKNDTGLMHCADEIDNVRVRKHQVDIPKLKALLKKHKKPLKKLCKDLDVNYTLAEHWFRKGKSFSIPPEDMWLELKEYLGIETDEFDSAIMEFEEREGVFESAKRIYDSDGAYPTITAAQTLPKVLVDDNSLTHIRRLTPIETERLQGLPDNYTQIPFNGKPKEECPVSRRYEACGRTMAINVMDWLGQRIDMVEKQIQNEN